MASRPKYYIGRSFLIYFSTLITGTIISSFILNYFHPLGSNSFFEDLLTYMFFGMAMTSVWCIPILVILIFGFWYIYSRSKGLMEIRKNIKNLSLLCIVIPLIIITGIALSDFGSWKTLFPWVLVMISYATSGVFFVLFISHKADLRNPPEILENQITPELNDILDSGLDNNF